MNRANWQPTETQSLYIEMFGTCRLYTDAHTFGELSVPQALPLFAWLVLHSQTPQSRDQLLEMLYPDEEREAAQNRLRKMVHAIRKDLGTLAPGLEEVLISTRTHLQMNPERFTSDIAQFEVLVTEAHAEQEPKAKADRLVTALKLVVGEFLPDCYEEPILALRERVQEKVARARVSLVEALEKTERYEEAVAEAQILAQTSQTEEEGHLYLMRLYATLGHPTLVLQHYERYTALCKENGYLPQDIEKVRDTLLQKARRRSLRRVLSVNGSGNGNGNGHNGNGHNGNGYSNGNGNGLTSAQKRKEKRVRRVIEGLVVCTSLSALWVALQKPKSNPPVEVASKIGQDSTPQATKDSKTVPQKDNGQSDKGGTTPPTSDTTHDSKTPQGKKKTETTKNQSPIDKWPYIYLSGNGVNRYEPVTMKEHKGNALIAGVEYHQNSLRYTFLLCLTPQGERLWKTPLPSMPRPKALAINSKGDIYVTGYSGNSVKREIVTIKCDSKGKVLRTALPVMAEHEGKNTPTDILIDAKGSVYVIGNLVAYHSGTEQTGAKGIILKYNSNLVLQIPPIDNMGEGSKQWAHSYKGVIDDKNRLYVIGITDGAGVKSHNTCRVLVACFSPSGKREWAKQYGCCAAWQGTDSDYHLCLASGNILYAVGNCTPSSDPTNKNGTNAIVAKLDLNTGNLIWEKQGFQQEISDNHHPRGAVVDVSGNLWITAELDPHSGHQQWTMCALTPNGEPYFTGEAQGDGDDGKSTCGVTLAPDNSLFFIGSVFKKEATTGKPDRVFCVEHVDTFGNQINPLYSKSPHGSDFAKCFLVLNGSLLVAGQSGSEEKADMVVWKWGRESYTTQ